MATRTHYTVYGTVANETAEGKVYPRSVTQEFPSDQEGEAWAYIITLRTRGFKHHNYVLVKTVMTSVDRNAKAYGKWKSVHEILLRVGKGKAWYE